MDMSGSVQLRQQITGLHDLLSDLIEVQRASLPAEPEGDRAALGSRLDGLQERLQALRDDLARQPEPEAERQRLTELEVERINVVEPDGTLRMTISNRHRGPDPVVDGVQLKRQGGNDAGIIFFNDEGDECGGLAYGVRREGDEYGAWGGLLFDQHKQDQTVGIQYQDSNGRRVAGLTVWDRPDTPFREWYERYAPLRDLPEGPERDAMMEQMRAERQIGLTRVFVGKERDRSAVLNLSDLDGNVRLRLMVDAEGEPKLEFLDQGGAVTLRLPQ